MAFFAHIEQSRRLGLGLGLVVSVAWLAGCGGEDVKVYQVSKEAATHDHSAHGATSAAAPASAGIPTLEWETPSDWEQVSPGQMRYASFRVKGEEGKTADLGIFPLPGMGMGDLDNVNRWRGQVGQAPITEEERAEQALNVEVQGITAQVYEMAGESAGSGEKTRILGAILKRDGIPWYFKMTGDDALVAAQKEAFIGFLRSLRFGTAGQMELPPDHPPIGGGGGMAAAAPAGQGSQPRWDVPAGWQEVAGGQFLVAKFNLTGPDGAAASVNVSRSGGDGGGLVSNINRWRRQIGLEEVSAEEIGKQLVEVECLDAKASLVDMTGKGMTSGKPERVIGAVMPVGSETWFYKLSGSEALVSKEKDNFIKFVKTAKHPNA